MRVPIGEGKFQNVPYYFCYGYACSACVNAVQHMNLINRVLTLRNPCMNFYTHVKIMWIGGNCAATYSVGVGWRYAMCAISVSVAVIALELPELLPYCLVNCSDFLSGGQQLN